MDAEDNEPTPLAKKYRPQRAFLYAFSDCTIASGSSSINNSFSSPANRLSQMLRILRNRLKDRQLTLLGRAVALLSGELAANAVVWIAAGLAFHQADGILGLALLAWTIGLRHGLDADHISAIDNATRQLVSLGQLPITCGLWFSLGHSTIVIAVNIAIAISVDIYDKLDRVGSVGGIVGASVSASFLFLIACLNTFYLFQAIKERRRVKTHGQAHDSTMTDKVQGGCMVRIIGPILRSVDRPWKMYPVGILFGFGFDTASSIALLAISAIAQRGSNGESISHGKIVILPFLFTAGMTLVDSLDSVLMLYAYAGPTQDPTISKFALTFNDKKVALDEETILVPTLSNDHGPNLPIEGIDEEAGPSTGTGASNANEQVGPSQKVSSTASTSEVASGNEPSTREQRVLASKANTISSLSITLTFLSILVALSISLIEIMGLIGDNCTPCQEAAEDPNGGGLAGSWWRAWARANDQSGYIGAAIVGVFAAILLGYHVGRWGLKRWREKRSGPVALEETA